MSRTLYMVTCGTPLARRIHDGLTEAKSWGWEPVAIPTASSLNWINLDQIVDFPVVTEHRRPEDAKQLPPADAVVVAPLTFNTLTAWANGTANTYPLVNLCAALGARIPIVAVPFAKHDLAGHPGWLSSIAVLRYAGVTIVDPVTGRGGSVDPINSGTGEDVTAAFEWHWVLNQISR